ncbi:MAG: pyridoxal phosphate-dependent aminotransferase [Desulfomonilaceae bacterium]
MNRFCECVSRKSSDIPPFLVMDVLEEALRMSRTGEEVIHLEVGEPDFDTPSNIVEAGVKALRQGRTHYTSSVGIPELRHAISARHKRMYNVDVNPDNVIITSGSSPAIFLTLASILDPGDEVILSDPHYACYPNFVNFLGAIPTFVPVHPEDGFELNPSAVKKAISKRTKAIMINSPSNPTGTLITPENMKAISNLGVPIISDEIYHGLVYEGQERSILEFTDNAFVLNGFSKLYAMTGWRLGYVISRPECVRPIQKMSQNFFISAADFIQYAGVEALTNSSEQTLEMKRIFNERRKVMLKRLREIGFEIKHDPVGAFYILCDARKFSKNSYEFTFEILHEARVGVAPGIDFGENAEGFIRFSYTNSMENIVKGLDRIENYLHRRFRS